MTNGIIEGIGIAIGVVVIVKVYGAIKYAQGYNDGRKEVRES